MPNWWQTGVIYQIYPRSFQDTNGDGVGDIPGITRRLPYLKDLGVDAVWLSPVFVSPMADFGYDVADFTDVDPLFGTLRDLDGMIGEAHRLGLKVLLDLVPNHTSIIHPWFQESRASRENAKRDWYIWRDPGPDGGPPNNWLSEFGGSAWEYDEASGQYYYHAFLKEQPDLNWRNPEVVAAMHDVMRFWFERGIDGFRIDVLWHLIKDDQFRDNPENPDYTPDMPPHRRLIAEYSADRPEMKEVVQDLRQVAREYGDRLLIGEVYLPYDKLMAYYGEGNNGVHLPFNFGLLSVTWRARIVAELIEDYEQRLPEKAWPNWVVGNHDRKRVVGRLGPLQARIAAMLLLTLRGTPTIYYGDEIGLPHVEVPPEKLQDPFERNVPGMGVGRDGARTPMQWDAGPHAGFSDVEPWLPLAPDHRAENVANLTRDETSILTLHRLLLALRRERPALQLGAYLPIAAAGDVLLYARVHEDDGVLVALNFGDEPASVEFPSGYGVGTILVSTHGDRSGEPLDGSIDLRSDEGVVIDITGEEGR